VEASRKHGSFDTRWPCVRNSRAPLTAPWLDAEEAAEGLDWDAFSDRYFPERRRHDFEARSAYFAYRQEREWQTSPPRLNLVPAEPPLTSTEQELAEAGPRRLLAALAARPAPQA
jgi:hypothetical protein